MIANHARELFAMLYNFDVFVCGKCNENPFGVRGQRGDRKIQGRQKMCRDRGSNPGLRN